MLFLGSCFLVAAVISPVLSGAGHGAIPLPFIVALGDAIFSPGLAAPAARILSDVGTVYVIGVLVLTPLVALLLRLSCPRWACGGT